MQIKNTHERYGAVAQFMHWLIFLLVAGMLVVGFLMGDMTNSPDKFTVYGLHKSVGITVLALVLLRLWWKLINIRPALPATMSRLEKLAAHAGHAALYIVIVIMPLSGWLMSSAGGFTVSVFGWFTLPDLVAPDKVLMKELCELHEFLAWCIIGLVSLHAAAALLHHFYRKDNVLRRMLPFGMLLLGLLTAMPIRAEAVPYDMVRDKSQLKFVAIQNDAPVTGEFQDFTAHIAFDFDKPQLSHITAEVKTGSVQAAYGEVEKNLRLPEWLWTEKFPVATFKTTKISNIPMSFNYYAEGELTLRGKTVPVTLNFQVKNHGDIAIAEGYATLKRNDFGVGQGQWTGTDVIKNEVRVEFRITAKKQ